MIYWKAIPLSEPPLTLSLTNEQLNAFKDSAMREPEYPCHTEAIERAVLLVLGISQYYRKRCQGWLDQTKNLV